jgi:hypothetical protein
VTSTPDGSSPRGYSRFFLFGYRLKDILLLAILSSSYSARHFLFPFAFSSSRSLLLIRVAPGAMSGFLGDNHSLGACLFDS